MVPLRLPSPLLVLLLAVPGVFAGESKPVRVDLLGDPLPPGAVARLGTMRLRYASCMAFSTDGEIAATAQRDCVYLWDAATGKYLRQWTVPIPAFWAQSVALSPDGRKAAVLGLLGLDVVVWNVDKDSPLFTAHIKRQGLAQQLLMGRMVFSPDGKTLYSGNDQMVHAWDAESGKEIYRFQHNTEAESGIQTIVFSRDGKFFATAGKSQSVVRLWDTHAGKLLHVLRGHSQGVRCADFSQDGSLLAVGGYDRIVHLWDVNSGKEIRRLHGHADEVVSVAFSPDGKELATANPEPFFSKVDAILLWDLKGGANPPRKWIAAHGVTTLEYLPDGKTLAWICGKRNVRLLDARTGKERDLFASHHGDVNFVCYSPDGKLIATAGFDRVIRLWDPESGKPLDVLYGHRDAVNALAFSCNGKWLASTSNDSRAFLWDMEKKRIRYLPNKFRRAVYSAAFSPDGSIFVTSSPNFGIQSRDIRTGKELRPIYVEDEEQTDHNGVLVFSPDGKYLVSGGGRSIRLHHASDGKLVRKVKTEAAIASLAFSPDGRTLAYSLHRGHGSDESLVLWELASGKVRARLPGHRNHRGSLAFSPDGKLLASGSHDPGGDMNKAVHVWDLATGKELGAFSGHEQPVFGVAFSPDSKRLATASGDATVLIWDLAAVAARGPHPMVDNRSLKSPLDTDDLETTWKDLAGEDVVRAQQAVWRLARESRQAVAFLGQRLRLATEPSTARIASLIDDLDSESFSKREQASAELTRLGTSAEPLLRKAHEEKITLEMRKRIDFLLERLDVLAPLSGEDLRTVRAVEALESAGTREGRQLLHTLTKGSECARLTREAKASLQRLERRGPSEPRP